MTNTCEGYDVKDEHGKRIDDIFVRTKPMYPPCTAPCCPWLPFSSELESTRNRLNCKDREGRAVGNQLEARLQSSMTSKSYNTKLQNKRQRHEQSEANQ